MEGGGAYRFATQTPYYIGRKSVDRLKERRIIKMKKLNVFNRFPYKGDNILKKIKYFCNAIRFAWQRITKGYCDMDTWSIDYWFLNVMPAMLTDLRDNANGYPSETTESEWNATLNKMIHMFNEANSETCSKKNSLQEEYNRVLDEFTEKYGIFGEKLRKDGDGNRLYLPGDVPEYADISKRHSVEEDKLCRYREICKNIGFQMFSEYFWALWD